jgi:HAD superfamily hydrolase (TIGR01549 family)
VLRQIQSVLFDLDGTLTVPVIDFNALRRRLGLPDGTSLVQALSRLSTDRRDEGMAVIREAELEAAHKAKSNTGAIALLDALDVRGVKTAIITRNTVEAVDITLRKIGVQMNVVITREFGPIKPFPEPLFEAMRRLETTAHATLMVGDYLDDMEAGRAAGTLTCLVMNGPGSPKYEADLHVRDLQELLDKFKQEWK